MTTLRRKSTERKSNLDMEGHFLSEIPILKITDKNTLCDLLMLDNEIQILDS